MIEKYYRFMLSICWYLEVFFFCVWGVLIKYFKIFVCVVRYFKYGGNLKCVKKMKCIIVFICYWKEENE